MQETTSKNWRKPCLILLVTLECSWNMAAKKYWSKFLHLFFDENIQVHCSDRKPKLRIFQRQFDTLFRVQHPQVEIKFTSFSIKIKCVYCRTKADDNGAKAHIHPSLMNSAEQVTTANSYTTLLEIVVWFWRVFLFVYISHFSR